MSYILDALKKADAERARERSAVPGLDAQPDAGLGSESRRGALPWRVIAIGAVAAVAAVLAWLGLSREQPTVAADPVAAAPPFPPSPPPSPPPAMTQQVPVAAAPTAPAAAPTATASSLAPAVATATAPARTAAAAPAPAAPRPVPVANPARATAPAEAPAPKVSAPAAADAKLPTLAQLPADLRAALPPLGISGAVYAPQAAGRMVFLNGQVLREGSEVAAGLTVERIGPDATVMSFRGTRFQLKH